MQRALTFMSLALLFGVLPSLAQAQTVIIPNGRVYAPPPVLVAPSTAYYVSPGVPSVTTYSAPFGTTYSYYPSTTVYSAPAPVVSYSAPIVTYAAPAPVYIQPSGYYEARTTYGYGIFRPRGYTTQVYYRP